MTSSTITSQDQYNLEQLAKEARELPDFHPEMLFDLFFGGDIGVLVQIIKGDDGYVDYGELDLFHWYCFDFREKVRSEQWLANEALNMVFANM